MFNTLDDVSLFGKKLAGFVSGRGASTTAVAFAAPFVAPAQLPMVGLTVGLPIKAAVSSMEHYHREEVVLNNFREEIAGYFGIDSDEVTHDNLRSLAFGNAKIGLEPQPFFEEIVKKNDTSRWVDLGANIGATALAVGFVFAKGAAVAGALSSLASSSGIALLVANPVIAGFIGLSIATALVVHALDFVITEVCKDSIGIKDKTSYEMLEDLAKHKGKGHEITPDRVMSVVANIDKGLKAEIVSNYGAPYGALPEAQRIAVLEKYATPLNLAEHAAKINSGEMKINELAFIGAGERSGVHEREIVAIDKPSHQGLSAQISNMRQVFNDKADERNSINAMFRDKPTLGVANMSTAAAVANVQVNDIANDMPHAINFSGAEELPQTKIAPEGRGVAISNMMQNTPMLSQAIH